MASTDQIEVQINSIMYNRIKKLQEEVEGLKEDLSTNLKKFYITLSERAVIDDTYRNDEDLEHEVRSFINDYASKT